MNSLDSTQLNSAFNNDKRRILLWWLMLQVSSLLQVVLLFLSHKINSDFPVGATPPSSLVVDATVATLLIVLLLATTLMWRGVRAGRAPSSPLDFKTFTSASLTLVQLLTMGGLVLTLNLHDLHFFGGAWGIVLVFDALVVLPRCLLYWHTLKRCSTF